MPYNFAKIQGVQSNIKYNCFWVKGKDVFKKNVSLPYRLNVGILIQFYEDCWNIDLARHESFIKSRRSNINGGNLTINNNQDLNTNEN